MDYEKLHKDTITKLQEMVNSGKIRVETARGICADFVPESEGEGIRKWIIDELNDSLHNIEALYSGDYDNRDKDDIIREDCLRKAVAWLEKQGEQKTIDEIAKEVCKNKVSAMTFLKSAGIMNEKGELADEYKIEQGEQNPEEVDNLHNYLYGKQKSTDKVKPKFNVGDWVVCNNGPHHIFQVIERSWPNAKYRDINGTEIFLNVNTLDKQYHLWTIQDAKDGDVLFTSSTASHETFIFKSIDEKGNAECYFAYDSEDGFREGKYHFIGSAINCKPATKEQRDLLFQKMREKGYEWDADKKELKKIENKPQNAWKPSDEQMKALSNAGNSFRPFEEGHKVLWGLYNDLKKLREK